MLTCGRDSGVKKKSLSVCVCMCVCVCVYTFVCVCVLFPRSTYLQNSGVRRAPLSKQIEPQGCGLVGGTFLLRTQ